MSSLCEQIQGGKKAIRGIMLESHLVEGNQPMAGELVYGQSITDACLALEDTVPLLQQLAAAQRMAG
jgi:3-deoxy-7-phosphoheptulonate synthase